MLFSRDPGNVPRRRLGQFLTHDSLGYVDGYNLYTYAGMDPINFWDPYGLGADTTPTSAFQNELLNSNFVRQGVDGGCAPGAQCFDTTQSDVDPTGAVGNVRRGVEGAENAADEVGERNRRATNDHRRRFKRDFDESSGLGAVGPGVGFVLVYVYGQLTPQSGDEVMLGVATLGLGPSLSGGRAGERLSKELRRLHFEESGAVKLDEAQRAFLRVLELGIGTKGRARVIGLLRPEGRLIGKAGSSSRVRILRGGQPEAEALFDELVRETNATKINKQGLAGFAKLPGDGGTLGFRRVSSSGQATIDVRISGLGIRKIKFNHDRARVHP